MSEELLTRIAMLESNLREVANAIARGDPSKLYAIKAWRAATGATLKDAKEYVDRISGCATIARDDGRLQRAEDRLHYLERRVSALEASAERGDRTEADANSVVR